MPFTPQASNSTSKSWSDSITGYSLDTPSRQLLYEIDLQNERHAREFNTRLDQRSQSQAERHRRELLAAAAEHERVLRAAERAQHKLQLELEEARRRDDLEAEQQASRALKEKTEHLERLAREAEERRATEARLRAAEEARARVDEEARREAARQEEIKAAKAAAPPPQPSPQPTQPPAAPAPSNSTAPAAASAAVPAQVNGTKPQTQRPIAASSLPGDARHRLEIHRRYIAVHKNLKSLRASTRSTLNNDKKLKERVGDCRRTITQCLGQLTSDMQDNAQPWAKIRAAMHQVSQLPQPTIDVRPYIATTLPPTVDPETLQAGMALTFALHMFAKAVFSYFVDEASVRSDAAEPLGTVAIRMFAIDEFRVQGISMIDMLVAKIRAHCPQLFGFKGGSPKNDGPRLTGIGRGFASLSLRNFGKAQLTNPFPPSNYWQAIACLVNVPPAELGEVHFILLKALTEAHAAKFVAAYGQAAIVALRKAIVELPAHAPKSVGAGALSTLQKSLRRELLLTL